MKSPEDVRNYHVGYARHLNDWLDTIRLSDDAIAFLAHLTKQIEDEEKRTGQTAHIGRKSVIFLYGMVSRDYVVIPRPEEEEEEK